MRGCTVRVLLSAGLQRSSHRPAGGLQHRAGERENRIRFVNTVNAVRIRFTERRRRIGRLKQWCWDHEAEVRKGPEVVFFEPISLIGCWRRSLRQTCAGVHGFCAFPTRVGRYAVQTKCLVRGFGRLLSIRRTGVRPWGRCCAEHRLQCRVFGGYACKNLL